MNNMLKAMSLIRQYSKQRQVSLGFIEKVEKMLNEHKNILVVIDFIEKGE